MPEILTEPSPSLKPAVEIKPRYTTQEQLQSYRPIMEDGKKWIRMNSKDRTLHRAAHIFPSFTGATGEDFVGHPDHPGDEKKTAQACFWRVLVERFTEKETVDKEGKPTLNRTILGSFQIDADKFLKEFEEA